MAYGQLENIIVNAVGVKMFYINISCTMYKLACTSVEM